MTVWHVYLVWGLYVPESRSICTESSVAEVGLHPTDELRMNVVLWGNIKTKVDFCKLKMGKLELAELLWEIW